MSDDPNTYTYRWTSDYPAVIAQHTTPEGTGVAAFPGKNFSTIAPVDSPFAKPFNAAAKKASDATDEQTDDAGGDSSADDPIPDGTTHEAADTEGAT